MTAAPSLYPGLSPADYEEAKKLRAATIALARRDPATFCEYVLRHEVTGKRITLAPMHEEWHDLMSTHPRLILWSHVEGGKTTQVAVGRLLYEIGRNPTKRYAVCGIAAGAATKIVTTVSRYIEHSPQFRAVFPYLRPASPWTTSSITVRRSVYSKDPTLQALGVRGHPIGARLDGIVLDDVLDHQTTRTAEQRKETEKWFTSELVGRLTEDAFVWVIGNAYYSDDLLHQLAVKFGYRWRKYPVADEKTGEPSFPQEWTRERIAKKEEELGGKGSSEAKRQLYCVARSEESSRVKAEWIEACLEKGEDVGLLERVTPEDLARLSTEDVVATTHTGVDIGVGKKKKNGKTVIWSVLRYPDGELQLVGLRAGRWGASEIVRNILTEQARFSSSVAVESNGAQKFLLDNAHDEDPGAELFVLPHHTGNNKHHPVFGVESVFVDLARAKLVLPSKRQNRTEDDEPGAPTKLVGATEEIREFVQNLLDYTPDSHTGDFLMAAWFARENARLFHVGSRTPTVGVKVIGAPEPEAEAADENDPDEDDELAAWAVVTKRRRAT